MSDINYDTILQELVSNVCNDCKTCSMECYCSEYQKDVLVTCEYCHKDGAGYVEVSLHSIDTNEYLDSRRLKVPGDALVMPFGGLTNRRNRDCNCL